MSRMVQKPPSMKQWAGGPVEEHHPHPERSTILPYWIVAFGILAGLILVFFVKR